jgi:hypothetical protein
LPLPLLAVGLTALAFLAAGCQKIHTTDLTPLDKAGVEYNDVQQLRAMNLSDAEVQQVATARQSGVADQDCIELVRIAHARRQEFTDGENVPMLLGAGLAKPTVLELAQMNQLGIWAGEAQAMHLARLSDQVILAVAARRAAGQPVLSGGRLASLQELGYTESQLIGEINAGTTDADVDAILARSRDTAGRRFVLQRGLRRR